ncbi:hypothetical protein [Mesonia sp.]|uniref:hypothetical protein n=1 Tax=Mesonia sp. TaxID=1960830 RepID=UPI00176919A0|nr:hypothetical protein [Mesonia sp.]HIB35993.1 hypothetical protein [Mesonia sp.]HIO27553.1 hypothetical protein [Flavobacteriaceae bacterium]
MTAYLTEYEIRTSLKTLVKQYLENCKDCDQLSEEFVELIRHTLKAKYANYNKETRTIEIGVKEENNNSFYNDIKSYSYSLEDAEKELGKSFDSSAGKDLHFYGKFINGTTQDPASEVVIIK